MVNDDTNTIQAKTVLLVFFQYELNMKHYMLSSMLSLIHTQFLIPENGMQETFVLYYMQGGLNFKYSQQYCSHEIVIEQCYYFFILTCT